MVWSRAYDALRCRSGSSTSVVGAPPGWSSGVGAFIYPGYVRFARPDHPPSAPRKGCSPGCSAKAPSERAKQVLFAEQLETVRRAEVLRSVGGDDDLDPLELLELGVA